MEQQLWGQVLGFLLSEVLARGVSGHQKPCLLELGHEPEAVDRQLGDPGTKAPGG